MKLIPIIHYRLVNYPAKNLWTFLKYAVSQQILVFLQKVDEEEEEDRPPPQLVEQDSDKLANVIAEKLTPEMATELVLIGLMELPNSIPPHFNSAYTPIAAAGCYLL